MRDVTPFKFKPPVFNNGPEVEFLLLPLDLQGLYQIQSDMAADGQPSWETTDRIARRHIVGWTGLTREFSREALHDVLGGEADISWVVWLRHIMAEFYRRALLSETERKN